MTPRFQTLAPLEDLRYKARLLTIRVPTMPSQRRFLAFLLVTVATACSPSRREAPDDETPGGAVCGNGVVEAGETCDSAIKGGEGACPASCPASDACAPLALSGSAENCSATCRATSITTCKAGDSCCAPGCTENTDPDCRLDCGNGQVDDGETCDGDCPETCNDSEACTLDRVTGSASTCTFACRHTEITACRAGDGCCPSGCAFETDADCGTICGDGLVQGGETCDGNCPTSCDDRNACTSDAKTGLADRCTVRCVSTPIVACVPGDGCCPAGCTRANDSDCAVSCGDGVVDPPEICDGNCPTESSCPSPSACVKGVVQGSARSCNATCGVVTISTCVSGDGCCPGSCTPSTDSDCGCPQGCPEGSYCEGNACVPQRATGAACTDDAQCTTYCMDESTYGWPGGQCGSTCYLGGCDVGAKCVEDTCRDECATNAECRTGYECRGGTSTRPGACVPVGRGTSPVGGPCRSTLDCAPVGGEAICYTQGGPKATYQGYCSSVCPLGTQSTYCPSGTECYQGNCRKRCSSSADCRGRGYDCISGFCWVSATGPGAVGDPCVGPFDCGGGAQGQCSPDYVAASYVGGYCTLECSNSTSCPAGSACVEVGSFFSDSYCLKTCTSSSQCRAGYTCASPSAGDPKVCVPP